MAVQNLTAPKHNTSNTNNNIVPELTLDNFVENKHQTKERTTLHDNLGTFFRNMCSTITEFQQTLHSVKSECSWMTIVTTANCNTHQRCITWSWLMRIPTALRQCHWWWKFFWLNLMKCRTDGWF